MKTFAVIARYDSYKIFTVQAMNPEEAREKWLKGECTLEYADNDTPPKWSMSVVAVNMKAIGKIMAENEDKPTAARAIQQYLGGL